VLVRAWINGAVFVMVAGLVHAQAPPGPGMYLEPRLPRQAAAPAPGMQPQPMDQTGGGSLFFGSVPQGEASSEELPLSLADAIARGLRYNLGSLLAGQSARAARGARLVALSGLLPNIATRTSESSQQLSLASFGFPSFPGIQPILGPFGISDARGYVSQSILDLPSIQRTRAASQDVKSSSYSSLDAQDAVVLVVTNLYLEAVAGASRVDAARAQTATAEATYKQAVDFKQNGVVPEIDVLRAQVEFQAQRQRLIFFSNEFDKQKLTLGRATGLPDGQPLRLTDAVPFAPMPPLTLEEALSRALGARRDYQSMLASARGAELARKAADAERLPSLDFSGDYGVIGPSLANSHGTYTATVSLNIPIFQGGRVRGEVLEADAAVEQRRAQLADLRGRIAFEVRTAFLDLNATSEQVQVSRSAVGLAQQQLTQARDRFVSGVTNNLEVTQAQEAVATANENYISSLYAYNAAKAALGRAIGGAEKTIPSFLQGVMP
jgi:outer membrane protein TolC